MQVGGPVVGTGAPGGAPHGPPIGFAMLRTKKYRTAAVVRLLLPGRQARLLFFSIGEILHTEQFCCNHQNGSRLLIYHQYAFARRTPRLLTKCAVDGAFAIWCCQREGVSMPSDQIRRRRRISDLMPPSALVHAGSAFQPRAGMPASAVLHQEHSPRCSPSAWLNTSAHRSVH